MTFVCVQKKFLVRNIFNELENSIIRYKKLLNSCSYLRATEIPFTFFKDSISEKTSRELGDLFDKK